MKPRKNGLNQTTPWDLEGLANRFHRGLTAAVRAYLQGRGLTDAMIDGLRLGAGREPAPGFAPRDQAEEFFSGCVVIPVRGPDGTLQDLVGIPMGLPHDQFRSLTGRTDLLYCPTNLDNPPVLFLCEHPFDAIVLAQMGVDAVAVFGGQNLHSRWLPIFQQRQVYVAFRPDLNGRRHAYQAMHLLAPMAQEVFHLQLPAGTPTVSQLVLQSAGPAEALAALIARAHQEGRYRHFSPDALRQEAYVNEVKRRGEGALGGLPTGLPPLDDLLLGGLREGLYVFAGPPGSGKTTLLRQVAETVAAGGRPVLYVSLESSGFELWARSIARRMGCATGEVLSGQVPSGKLEEAARAYAEVARWIWTVEGADGLTLTSLGEYVRQSTNQMGRAPLVVVDYLERLPLEDPLPDATGAVEAWHGLRIAGLKQIALSYSCPVLVASTVDPDWAQPGAWGGFAGRGDLQHTADVIALLRPGLAACAPDCGPVTLDLIKHRNGRTGQVALQFHRRSGWFEADNEEEHR